MILYIASVLLMTCSLGLSQSTGDTLCTLNAVCISAVMGPSETIYTLNLTSTRAPSSFNFGWIGMGFGQKMVGSPMVIVWPNSDSSITLSQRLALTKAQPTLQPTPSVGTARLVDSSTVLNGFDTKISFSLPNPQNPGNVPIIWAYGTTNPGSKEAGANLMQHSVRGTGALDLTNALAVVPAESSLTLSFSETLSGSPSSSFIQSASSLAATGSSNIASRANSATPASSSTPSVSSPVSGSTSIIQLDHLILFANIFLASIVVAIL